MKKIARLIISSAVLLIIANKAFPRKSGERRREKEKVDCAETVYSKGPCFLAAGYTIEELANTKVREWDSASRLIDSFYLAGQSSMISQLYFVYDTLVHDPVLDKDTFIAYKIPNQLLCFGTHLLNVHHNYEIIIGENPSHWFTNLKMKYSVKHGGVIGGSYSDCRLKIGFVDGKVPEYGNPEVYQEARCDKRIYEDSVRLFLQRADAKMQQR